MIVEAGFANFAVGTKLTRPAYGIARQPAVSMMALGLALLLNSGAAHAQEAAPAPAGEEVSTTTEPGNSEAAAAPGSGDEVVVTGLRASIRSSVAQKRNNTSIVEVVTAEDIGKLPDASIAESLSRLPGLTSQRFDGRASKLSVRGLAPDFTMTTLNGREMVSSDNNRAVEFDQFPSELLNGAVVYKTPDAALTAQAIGGTVDLLTIRPLSSKGRTIVVGARGEMNDKGKLNPDTKDKGYRFNVAYIDQNAAGTLGWALGYARMLQPIQEQYVHVWGYGDLDPSPNGRQLFVDGIKPYVKSNELTRDGLLGVLEVKPSPTWRSRVDVFYSKFTDNQTLRGQEIAGYTADSREVLETDGDVVTSGRWNGIHTQARSDFTDRDSKTMAIGLNNLIEFGDAWTAEVDASYSKAKRSYQAVESYVSTGRGQSGPDDDITFNLGGSNGLEVDGNLNYADPSLWRLGDNLGWGGPLCTEALGWQCASQDGFINTESSKDDLKALRVAATRELNGPVKAIRFGGRYAMRDKDHSINREWLTLNAYPALLAIPTDLLVDPADLGFMGLGETISYDTRELLESGVYYRTPNDALGVATNRWSVEEKIFNGYVMADLDASLGAVPLTGNIGVQVVHTDQSSDGTRGQNANGTIVLTDVTEGDKYWDVLPSANLIFGLSDDHKLRLSVARVLARARMNEMNASRTLTFDPAKVLNTDVLVSPWGGNGGNPQLRPWRAWQLDASYEYYFGNGGYFAVAPFYKKLQNYIFGSRVLADFTGVVAPGPIQPTLTQGYIDSFDNGEGGKIYGLELSASLPFGNFVPALEGFGALGSASFTRSKVRREKDGPSEQLPGLSRNVFNGTIYYDRGGFGARLSARHRSKFLAESYALGLSRELTMAKEETILDAQLSYDLTNVGVKGLTLYLQGSNLTDEPFIQYFNNDPTQFRHWHTYGRNFMAGATFKF
jgi:iron complex outermembrane receptor protein